MSQYRIGNGGRLYDFATGELVGWIDSNGQEQLFVGVETSLDGWVRNMDVGIAPSPASRQIALIGDSRQEAVWYKWGIAVSSPSGIPTNELYINFQGAQSGATLGGTGTFEYDAPTDKYRWTAPGDTPGPWVAADVGAMLLPSGSANAGLFVTVWRKPTVTASQAVVLAATKVNFSSGWAYGNRHGLAPYIASEFPDVDIARLGAGGSKLEDGVSMLPWYQREAGGDGFDVFWYGTNNINSSTGLAGMIANAQTILDARIALGRRIVVIGEHARWGAAVNTPLTAGQIADLKGYNAWLQDYCDARPFATRYVDALSLTADTGYADCRPLTAVAGAYDMLYDIVHPYIGASLAIAPVVVAALRSLGLAQYKTPPRRGDAGLMDFEGKSWFLGTGGTASTNVTTTTGVPTGITASTSNAAMTATFDIAPALATPGRALKWTFASAGGGAYYARAYSGTTTLANAGWAIGDRVKLLSIVTIENANELDVYSAKLTFMGSNITIEITPGSVPGTYWLESPEVEIPAGTTGVMWEFRVTAPTTGTSSGSGRLEALVGIKV